jgi:hypothetical protein
MANNPIISPERLASKAFLITFVGAVLYFTTVFVFVIGGNNDLHQAEQTSDRVGDIHD